MKKQYPDLFPEVSKQARLLAGIKFKPTDADTKSSSTESGSGRDLDSNADGNANAGNHQLEVTLSGGNESGQ